MTRAKTMVCVALATTLLAAVAIMWLAARGRTDHAPPAVEQPDAGGDAAAPRAEPSAGPSDRTSTVPPHAPAAPPRQAPPPPVQIPVAPPDSAAAPDSAADTSTPAGCARGFLAALSARDFDKARELIPEDNYRREKGRLEKITLVGDLGTCRMEALAGSAADAVAICSVSSTTPRVPGTVYLSFKMLRYDEQWWVRDIDFLPDDAAVQRHLEEFFAAFKDGKPIPLEQAQP